MPSDFNTIQNNKIRKLAWLFSGQGSQYPGMCNWYFENDSVYRNSVMLCEEITYLLEGVSFIDNMLSTKSQMEMTLVDTRVSNCALFSVQYAMAKMLQSKGLDAQFLIGFSLGEFVAHTIAGAMSPETALRALLGLAETVEKNSPIGAMTAVVKQDNYFYQSGSTFESCTLATTNGTQSFVVAGHIQDIEKAEQYMSKNGVAWQRLPVKYAFHSPLIDNAEGDFKDLCRTLNFRQSNKPVISSALPVGLRECNADSLWHAVRQPVMLNHVANWCETNVMEYAFDLGPSGTFANSLKESFGTDTLKTLCSPFTRNNANELQLAIEAHQLNNYLVAS